MEYVSLGTPHLLEIVWWRHGGQVLIMEVEFIAAAIQDGCEPAA